MNNVEIERKWLMDAFPDAPHFNEVQTEQGYLTFEPSTVRIRHKIDKAEGDSYRLTIKGKGTLRRTEVEVPLDASQYEALLELLVAPPASKRLRLYRLPGGEVMECSLVDEGEPTAFYYAEVEFEREAAARAFVPPAYMGREVTDEPGFTMAAYCRRKLEDARNA